MKKFHSNSIKALAFSASALAFVIAGPVAAQGQSEDGQDDDDEEEKVQVTTDAKGRTDQGGITVTGSRIVRDTYSSISPLQILSTENQQAVGAFDPAQILQRSEVAAGIQIDASFNGFVLDNGPGSQTINLRGLGADRTLVLVNGRRLAPAGVEGAPVNPSINLIPASLIDRFDLLTDGASSIYGSDAVAGVVNAILRKDFDGLELQFNGNLNEQGAGNDFSVSGAWGFNTDRAVFGIGAEYRFVEEFRRGDRDFLRGCTTNLEIDEQGNLFRVDRRSNALVQELTEGALTVRESECVPDRQAGFLNTVGMRVGSIFAPTNGNIANFPNDPITGRPFPFGDSQDAFAVQQDRNGDGIRDVDFQNINTNDSPEQLLQTIIPEQQVINVFTYGEYTFPGEANITPFFEAQYTRSDVTQRGAGNPQLFPWVPGFNQFNPCNFVDNPNGVDCRAVDNEFNQLNPGQANAGRLSRLSTGIQLAILPVAAIRGDRNNFEVTQEQYRGVLGVRGDLPFLGPSWTFEASGVYSRSEGFSTRDGIRFDRLALSLGIDPTADFNGDGIADNNGNGVADEIGNVPINSVSNAATRALFIGECNVAGLSNPDLAAPDLNGDQCIPVNLFTADVLTGAVGDLPAAERAYLFGERDVLTIYEQTIAQAYISGDLFELPAGPVGVSLGVEWREDAINTQAGNEAADGLFFGFFADQGALGSAWIREAFGEIDIPLMAGQPLVEELNVNISGRLTDQQFYGTNFTYAIKGGWRPVSPLLMRFTYGTSFRAPNLRENFLAGQSGFNNGLFDPCAVPADAFNAGAGGYQPELDEREPFVLENCRREGRDPTRVGIDGENTGTIQFTSAEVTTGGTFDIDPERSTSLTAGFAFEESWASGFDLALSVNYYDIQLTDTIIEPSSQFIVNDCFLRDDGVRSDFCDRISIAPTERRLINAIEAGFLNRDSESVRGIDINATMSYPVNIGGEDLDLQLNIIANKLITRELREVDEAGVTNITELQNNFGFPEWTGRATFNVGWKEWLFTYQVRYVDYMQADGIIGNPAEDIDGLNFTDAFGRDPDGNTTRTLSNGNVVNNRISPACLGLDSPQGFVAGEGNFCRPVGFTPEWFEHTASLRWDNGDYRIIAGITNLFDTPPPLISPAAGGFQISNVPLGLPFNLDGREFFIQLLARF